MTVEGNNNRKLTSEEAWMIVLKKESWLCKMARQYAWGGAEFDDLHQIARLTAFLLLMQSRNASIAAYHMQKVLPFRLLDAAQKLRWKDRYSSLEGMALMFEDEDGEGDGIEIDAVLSRLGFSSRTDLKLMQDTERKELKRRLHSVLTPEQRVIVDLLMDGCHCFEICAMLDIKRQALESRLKKIGKRIRPVLNEWRKSGM